VITYQQPTVHWYRFFHISEIRYFYVCSISVKCCTVCTVLIILTHVYEKAPSLLQQQMKPEFAGVA